MLNLLWSQRDLVVDRITTRDVVTCWWDGDYLVVPVWRTRSHGDFVLRVKKTDVKNFDACPYINNGHKKIYVSW